MRGLELSHVTVFVSDRTAWSDCSVGQIQDWDTLIGQWGRVFLGENATAVAIMAEEDSLVLILEVHFRGIAETILVPYTNWESLNVDGLRGSICSSVEGLTEGDGRSTWLVFKGRKLAGRELVKDIGIETFFRDDPHGDGNLGIENYSKVFMGVTRPDGASEEKKPTPLLRESSTSPESKKFPTGLTSLLASNPEFMLEMMQSNPKMRQLLERNPQIRHALSDPKTMKELLEMNANPRAMQEMMRGHDRALSNIENLPGGFQALQHFYTQELQEVESGVGDLHLAAQNGSPKGTTSQSTDNGPRLVSEPMPNPWSQRPFDASEGVRAEQLPDYERRFAQELATMRELGFTDTRENVAALVASGGDVNRAIDRIVRIRTRFEK